MSWQSHELAGCAPVPLAGYLKALGVMRTVCEQKESDARGLWRGDRFVLITRMGREELVEFFGYKYQPTPLVAPWNGGSGFYARDYQSGLDAILGSTAPRFAAYREAIAHCLHRVGERDEAPRDQDKLALVRACRAHLRGSAAEWLDAAVLFGVDGRLHYPAILGTGGNDGRLDFTRNQMQRLVELLSTDDDEPRGDAEHLLIASLFGETVGGLSSGVAIGQFFPGAVGSPNSTSHGQGVSLVNSWDYVLMLEGAPLVRASALRRLDAHRLPQAAAPFAVRAQAADYASAAPTDESSRGEIWLPLWSQPATLSELRALFEDAFLQTGPRRARRALDAARAAARRAVARGVSELVRFGFIERNGQANLAVPLGRWPVTRQPCNPLLDDIELWLDVLHQRSTMKYAPANLGRHVRDLERIVFALCREGGSPERWGELLCALGRYEDQMVARPRSMVEVRVSPVPRLCPEWLRAADDGSVEFRLATALASQYSRDMGSIRRHCVPPNPRLSARYGGRFHITAQGEFGGRDLVWTGLDPISDLCAVVWRRMECSRQRNLGGFELRGRLCARLEDMYPFLSGKVDDARLTALARGLMAVRWHHVKGWQPVSCGHRGRDGSSELWPVYALFRLLYRPAQPRCTRTLDPAPLRGLLGGRLVEAARLAMRRLGLTRGSIGEHDLGEAHDSRTLTRRLAASLCFPIDTTGEVSVLAGLRRVVSGAHVAGAMRGAAIAERGAGTETEAS